MGKEDIEKMVTDTGMMLFTKSDVINLITQAIELERMNHV